MSAWIEAMRLRTLPVSVAGVAAGTGCAAFRHGFSVVPMLICLVFAVVAQIASNFANEYFDYKYGLDKKGREGFRRGVTEGDISPRAMLRATLLLLAFDSLLGCSLIWYGGWWMIAVGVAVAVFALAYSAGPWPLSHHGLGDLAVVFFFGFVPVTFTAYLQMMPTLGVFRFDSLIAAVSLAVGLMAANVLIVNNCRDCEADREVGKRTTAVILGRKTMTWVYLVNGFIAALCMAMALTWSPMWTVGGIYGYIVAHVLLWQRLRNREGSALNNVLKFTSIALFGASLWMLAVLCIWPSGSYPF